MRATFEKEYVIKRLHENLQKHFIEHDKAMEGWRRKMVAEAEAYIAEVQNAAVGGTAHFWSQPAPTTHEESYEEAIKMLRQSSDSTVTLDEKDFRRLMLDKWEWRESWVASNSQYTNG